MSAISGRIEALFAKPAPFGETDRDLFEEFVQLLDSGQVRAAEPDPKEPTGWRVNSWVKKGILVGFRLGELVEMSTCGFPFFDKSTYPLKPIELQHRVRIVPGGSSIRLGAYVASSVTCMPPMYINVGAHVEEGVMIDSHALVGSCAQIGKRVHLSAAAQIGGVLEPVGAMPVIIEDDVLVGGNCGIYEGTIVKRGAVLGTGTILNRSTPIYDLARGVVHRAEGNSPLIVPGEAVVAAGSRAVTQGPGKDWNISIYTPVVVKYRDERTDLKVKLEELLR